jgi:membrane protease YdiL (CAAX protease family)
MVSSNSIIQSNNPRLRRDSDLKRAYFIGLFIIFASAYSQYLVGGLGLIRGMLLVYGVPLLAVSSLWGSTIIRRAFNHMVTALKLGVGFFGAFTLLGLLMGTLIFYILVTLDPAAVNLLHRPNPVLNISPEYAEIMVLLSFVVIGPVEEYLFRGFIYGGLLNLFGDRNWLSLAFISSILFAAAHLYYAFVYGIASLIQFTDLVTFGMAMAATYYLSGGNLLVPALIHGAYDATGFIGIAVSPDVGVLLRGSMILIGILVAIVLSIPKIRKRGATTLIAPLSLRFV